MAISDTTPVEETRWPRWVWLVAAAFAIAIGGGLGHWVGTRGTEPQSQARPARVQPPVKPPEPAAPAAASTVPAESDHEIEIEPESVPAGASPSVRHVRPKPKQPAKPIKHTPCNVYDHMDGC